MEPDTADMLGELASLAKGNIYIRTCVREFLDTRPLIAILEADHAATMRTGHPVMREEPSQGLRRCLATCRVIALNEKRDDFCGAQSHDGSPQVYNCPEITPAMIEAGRAKISLVWLDFIGPRDSLLWDEVLTAVFRAMWESRQK